MTRQFIVLKQSDGILRFTDFHKYINSPINKVRRYTSDGNNRFIFVAQMLNYAFFHAGICKLDDITSQRLFECVWYVQTQIKHIQNNSKKNRNNLLQIWPFMGFII